VTSNALKRAKRRVRREVLAARDAIPPERREAMSVAIAERFVGLPEVERASTVMLFWSFGSEVDTAPLIDRLRSDGTRLALPRIEGADLVPVGWQPGDPTTPTSFGAREPTAASRLAPDELDVVAVPAVAVDRRGRRIGYGGGYYDRFLPTTSGTIVVPAFTIQVLDEDLPAGPADVPVDAIVTESVTIRPAT
jgi:5-formyltetrahydrofolate cyclo-ligase